MSTPGGVIVEYHILRALEDQGFSLDIQRDNKSAFRPEALFDALAKYGQYTEFKVDEQRWEEAWQITWREFGGHGNLVPLETKEELRAAIKEEKSSGAPLFSDKGVAFESDFRRMERYARGMCAAQPCVAYHRIQHGVTGPKTRLVWGYPLHMTLLEAKYARPLITEFLRVRTPMAFGLHRHELAARMLPITNSGLRYGFDFSGFDSSIHPRMISRAFMVLRSHFKTINEPEWDRMIHYFIHTPILMSDGFIYTVHKGVPSGSYFTQLVDSIINYFSVQYATLSLTGKPVEREKLLVLGDDGLVGFDVFIPLPKWTMKFKELGLTLSVSKSELTRFGEPVSFLGHTWKFGVVDRAPIDVAKRMAFPERPVLIDDPRLRIVSRVLAYGSDALSAHTIIMKWARYKGPDVRTIYFRDTLTDPVMGWREFVSGDRPSRSFPAGALDQMYLGVLV
jgi:hypothetical protein